MNCHYHPRENAIGDCRLCSTPVCKDCVTVVKGNVLCPDCINAAETAAFREHRQEPKAGHQSFVSQESETPANSVESYEPRSKFLTFVLSFLPGLGHLYLGLTRQGIELMGLFFGSIWLTSIFNGIPFVFIIPVLFFYGIFDALQKRDRLARGIRIDPNLTFFKNVDADLFAGKKWIGWAVIILGGLMLFKEMGAYQYFYRVNDILVAILLVGAGVWMLNRERRQPQKRIVSKEPDKGEEPPHA